MMEHDSKFFPAMEVPPRCVQDRHYTVIPAPIRSRAGSGVNDGDGTNLATNWHLVQKFIAVPLYCLFKRLQLVKI